MIVVTVQEIYSICKHSEESSKGNEVKARLESISDFMKSVEVSQNLMKYFDLN
jgi:hypothetical protein